MRRGEVREITTVAGRSMAALVVSDVAIAAPVGYVFIAPLLPEPGSRAQVTTPISALDSYALLWRMQGVPAARAAEGAILARATEQELASIDALLKALLGL